MMLCARDRAGNKALAAPGFSERCGALTRSCRLLIIVFLKGQGFLSRHPYLCYVVSEKNEAKRSLIFFGTGSRVAPISS